MSQCMSVYERSVTNLKRLVEVGDSYDRKDKRSYNVLSKKILDELVKELGFKKNKVHYNSGGPAVWGDATVHGMWSEENGVSIHVTHLNGQMKFMYRGTTAINDYTGGQNHWMPMVLDMFLVVKNFKRMDARL